MRLILPTLPVLFLMTCSCVGQTGTSPDRPISNFIQPLTMACDTVSESGPNIMSVFHDSRNVYWFGSWENGLYRYDPSVRDAAGSGFMFHFTTDCGLPHNRVEDIQEDASGRIYINTPAGVCRYDGQKFTLLPVIKSNEWTLHIGDLWFKSLQFNGKVLRFDGEVLYEFSFPTSPLGDEWRATHPSYPDPHGIYTLYQDRHGYLWFGTAALGVCRYDGHSFNWISGADINELHDGPSNGVRSIIEDAEGRFWFCSTIFQYTVDGNSSSVSSDTMMYSRQPGIGSLDGIPGSDFLEYMSAVVDSNGHVWMATYSDGVYQYDGENIIHHPVRDEGRDITLFSIYKDNHGTLWLGTHENGVFRYNGGTFERFRP